MAGSLIWMRRRFVIVTRLRPAEVRETLSELTEVDEATWLGRVLARSFRLRRALANDNGWEPTFVGEVTVMDGVGSRVTVIARASFGAQVMSVAWMALAVGFAALGLVGMAFAGGAAGLAMLAVAGLVYAFAWSAFLAGVEPGERLLRQRLPAVERCWLGPYRTTA